MDSVIFALIFSEFGYVPDFFYVPNFFLEHSQILKKSRQKWLSPKLFSECQVLYLCFLLHKFLKTLKFSKCQVLDLVIFALIFSEFGYVPRKSLGHRKNLEHSQIQKKSRQKWLSPNLTLRKYLYMDTPNKVWSLTLSKKFSRFFV